MTQPRNTFTARSVIASLLLGTPGGRLSGRRLVRAAEALGVAEGTTRVALSRMVSAGEITADDAVYALAGPLLARRARQEEGRHPATTAAWDGTWRLAIVGSDGGARPAAARADVRRRLAGLRLAEWREGIWVRPDNLAPQPADGWTWVTGALPQADLTGLWDLAGWAAGARRLLVRLGEEASLGDAFAVAAETVRHLRDDPLLPDELLPDPWPGPDLRAAYDRYEADFQRTLRTFF